MVKGGQGEEGVRVRWGGRKGRNSTQQNKQQRTTTTTTATSKKTQERKRKQNLGDELVDAVLVVAADAQVLVARDGAGAGLEVARHQLEQRRLAGAVGADQGDAAVAVDAKLEVLFLCWLCFCFCFNWLRGDRLRGGGGRGALCTTTEPERATGRAHKHTLPHKQPNKI